MTNTIKNKRRKIMTISLTRLLNEIKLLDDKIDKKISTDINFFDIRIGNKLLNYDSDKTMKSKVTSHLNSIRDLISKRDKYKSILLKANNETTVTVSGITYTIAEVIAKKQKIYQDYELISQIKQQYTKIQNDIINIEDDNRSKLDELIKLNLGKDRKVDEKDFSSITKTFNENNKVELVDVCKVYEYYEKLLEELDEFRNDIDFTLSEINAKTEVTIED
jgi:hypothetical protein